MHRGEVELLKEKVDRLQAEIKVLRDHNRMQEYVINQFMYNADPCGPRFDCHHCAVQTVNTKDAATQSTQSHNNGLLRAATAGRNAGESATAP